MITMLSWGSASGVNGFETLTSSHFSVEQQFCGLYLICYRVTADGAEGEILESRIQREKYSPLDI